MSHAFFFFFHFTQKEHAGREIANAARDRYVGGVEPKFNYSFPISEAEKPHTYFSDIYSALNAFKELALNKMV